jgi:hypothetical protein
MQKVDAILIGEVLFYFDGQESKAVRTYTRFQ